MIMKELLCCPFFLFLLISGFNWKPWRCILFGIFWQELLGTWPVHSSYSLCKFWNDARNFDTISASFCLVRKWCVFVFHRQTSNPRSHFLVAIFEFGPEGVRARSWDVFWGAVEASNNAISLLKVEIRSSKKPKSDGSLCLPTLFLILM